jgi:SAM-dependent methyltransferase
MGINPHYRCPWCNSSDKERLVWKYLTTKTDVVTTKRPLSVLHIAPEKNTQKKFRARPNITYIVGDMFSGASKYTSEHYGGAIYLDITDMSRFKDGTFDVIICNHVLEHVIDDRRGMREIYRTLKSGGFAILQVPVSRNIESSIEDLSALTEEERTERFGQSDHVRIYAEKDYLSRLAEVGFAVENIPCGILCPKKDAELWAVNRSESVYVAKKRSDILTP